jgi:hypothetical protein
MSVSGVLKPVSPPLPDFRSGWQVYEKKITNLLFIYQEAGGNQIFCQEKEKKNKKLGPGSPLALEPHQKDFPKQKPKTIWQQAFLAG